MMQFKYTDYMDEISLSDRIHSKSWFYVMLQGIPALFIKNSSGSLSKNNSVAYEKEQIIILKSYANIFYIDICYLSG